MTETSSSTLGEFETAGQPTAVSELSETANAGVREGFESIDRWQSKIRMNSKHEPFFVGRSPDHSRDSYRLYRSREDGFEFAGVLARDKTYGEETEHRVGFVPAGDSPSDETVVEPVTKLIVSTDWRTVRLNENLADVRTALTDSDWSDGRADTGYGEWIQAVNQLADFLKDEYEDADLQLSAGAVMESKAMHAVARYPLSAEDLLSQVADCFTDQMEDGVYDASPMAFRGLLLDYADENIDSA